MSIRDDLFAQACTLWGSFWRFEPSADEVETLRAATRDWPTLAPLTGALRHATETLDERPSVAWLIREGRKRLPERTVDTTTLCPDCLDDGWRNDAKPGQPPRLRPCPECRPLTAELWASNAYKVDAPSSGGRGDGNPEAQAIIDRHRNGGSPLGKRVLIAREPAMSEETREYMLQLVRANHSVGNARRERYEYLRGLAKTHRVTLPSVPIGDESAVKRSVELLREKGADVDQLVIEVPTPEQYLRGAKITRPPNVKDNTERTLGTRAMRLVSQLLAPSESHDNEPKPDLY